MMTSFDNLYQEIIIDHGRRLRNFAENACANGIYEGFNPLCGDRVTVYICEENGSIKEASLNNKEVRERGCASHPNPYIGSSHLHSK